MINRSAYRFLSPIQFVLTASLLLGACACAQAPFMIDDSYRLQPGDVIIVNVLGEEGLSGSLQVGPGGSVALPVVGSVSVVGKTLRETRDLVARNLQDLIRRPYVSVALDENASKRRVYVSGRIEKPGSQLLPLGATLPDAVVAAGFTEESDLSRVTLRRTSGEVIVADLSGLRTQQALDTGVVLQWDDRIFVPAMDNRLTVVGQVAKPGTYTIPLGRRLTVVDLVTQVAGGLTEQAARRAILMRGGGEPDEEIDLARLLEQGDVSQNYDLQGGDVLVVPLGGRITIAGEVGQPATLFPVPGMTLLEAIVRSGGFTPLADLRRAQLRRGNEVCMVDLEALWRRGDLTDNIVLQPDDVLIVPRARAEEVLVMGAVGKPGTVDIRDQDPAPTLLKLLASAGQIPASDLSRVSIYREDEHLVANADRALKQGDMRHNPILQTGDVVYVPEVGKVALLGAFPRAGLVDYDPNLTLLQYLALGGLPSGEMVRLEKGAVVRTRPDGTYETVNFDVSKIAQGKIPDPIKIMPGDVIFLQPRGVRRDLWTQIRDILFTAGAIRGLVN